jgi:hypothetical protein
MIECLLAKVMQTETQTLPLANLVTYIQGGKNIYSICEEPDDFEILNSSYGS